MAGNFFGGQFFGGGFFGQISQVVVVVGAGGDRPTWEEYVKARNDLKLLDLELKGEEKKLASVDRKIVKAQQQVKKAEKPEGILANLWRLEQHREALQAKVEVLEKRIEPFECLVQIFQDQEIDDDDEEILLH